MLRVLMPCTAVRWMTLMSAVSARLPMGQKWRNVGRFPQLGNLELDGSYPSIEEAAPTESIAGVAPHPRALVAGGTNVLRAVCLHELLEKHCHGSP